MVDRTDRHFRHLIRLLTKEVLLYSEMHATGAILNGKVEEILAQEAGEDNCVLQIATDSPQEAYNAVKKVENLFHYSEYNLNVGCPSERVQKACYGAALMRHPTLVKEILSAMREATPKPVSAKIRLGIKKSITSTTPPDDLTSWENLANFVEEVSQSGIKTLTVHARIAILEGLSPKDNRQIPPLKKDWVLNLKKCFPSLSLILNGGIRTPEEIGEVLASPLQGVMIGRAAYDNPYLLAIASRLFLGETSPLPTRRQVLENMQRYMEQEEEKGTNVRLIYPHLMGLLYEVEGSRIFRRILSPPFSPQEFCRGRFQSLWERLPSSVLDDPIPLPILKQEPSLA
jgi:tRNA-dihydrouridine synthase A